MAPQTPLLTLLLLTKDRSAAERLVAGLRATGTETRALVTDRTDRISSLLSRRAFDIVLLWDHFADAALDQALHARGASGGDVPLIVLVEHEPTGEDLQRALAVGATDLVPAAAPERLLIWRLRRAASELRHRRHAITLASRLQQCEQRQRELIEQLQDQTTPALAPPEEPFSDPDEIMQVAEMGRARLFAEIDARLGPDRSVPSAFGVFFIQLRRHAELLRDLGLTHAVALFDRLGPELRSLIGTRHLLVRASEDGYAMLYDGLNEKAAEKIAERIRSQVHLLQPAASRDTAEPNCEVGYYLVKGRAADGEDILNAAHRLCLYRAVATSSAPDGAGMQTPTSLAARAKQGSVDGDSALAEKIAAAIGTEQFKLVYQPIISLMGDNRENYSVFVRLLDEQGELLEAKDFIGAAIRRGLIEKIDTWAVREAIRVLAEQRQAGHKLRFFINLAEDTFRNPNIIVHICDCLREFDIRGNWLAFQFQEELILDNLASLATLINALKQIKCQVAINRFGRHERPEMILQALPADFVVFTPDYGRELAGDPAKQQRLTALAQLAREFNLKSIATGVEDAEALTVLWTAGVDYVQGNFLQRPVPTLELQA
ncbi:hypothetical protein CKO25_14060 [Thiocapsa imhoffii]|uniref:EAL domain-containing protein n=1 Tax=Thiocapsa imhoffii TaxID=382777 RepID=A0A9X1BA54_9GAMM|nr:GGDEF domain-containing phosphodiesterase [Thiocapsa imhoffii]MBK1645755.1 hypothetical protein [Thiocapsa imhoffii]